MSHIIECSLNFKVDGVNYPGFPLIRRLQVDQLQPLGQVQTALSGYTALSALLTILQAGVVYVDQATELRLGNQGTGSIPVNATGATETLANASGITANNKGVAAPDHPGACDTLHPDRYAVWMEHSTRNLAEDSRYAAHSGRTVCPCPARPG